jgi:hypothetical protein
MTGRQAVTQQLLLKPSQHSLHQLAYSSRCGTTTWQAGATADHAQPAQSKMIHCL